LSKILTDLCVAFGDAHPPTTQNERAGENSFPPTPFLFARPLGLRPEKFLASGRRRKEKKLCLPHPSRARTTNNNSLDFY